MDKIVIFDTSYGSYNMGDYIINECAMKELKDILSTNFCLRVSTHNPVAHFYQLVNKRKPIKFFNEAKYKFLLGTNIIKKNMFWPWPDWNVNLFNCKPYKNTILVGVGMSNNFTKNNLYTKILYKNIFNKDLYHATRDEKTKRYLESLGLKAINTGCPTLWSIDEDLCKEIPLNKSEKAIITVTDYRKDFEKDQAMIDTVLKNYQEVFIWIQGSNDYEYFKQLRNTETIKIVAPNIEAYDSFLNNNDVDYIGTRLHAGIYAIRHKKRSIIISVDNRARDMKETYNLPILERNEIEKLETLINKDFETKIKVDKKSIQKWKSQFKK